MFAGHIKIVQLLLLYCIVVRSHVLHDDRLTQAELISEKTTTNTNNDFWWFVKPSGIYEFVMATFKWVYDVLASSWRAIVPAWSSGDKSSFSGIQRPPKSQFPLPANNGWKDQENTEAFKHIKSTLTQLKSISNETRSNDSSEILFVKQPTYFNFQIFQLVSLVYWWANDVLISNTVNKKSFDEPPREHQPSLPAKERNDKSKDLSMNAADVSKPETRSMLTQINAKSSVSEETTKDAKSYSHMLPWLSQSHRLQSMIDLWLDDVAASNTITNNKIFQHPLESQPPLPKTKESENKLIKERKRISQFFRIHEFTEMLKWWFNDTFPPNTIKNEQVVFQPSLENQSPLLAKENDDRLKDREKITTDDVLENVRSIVSQFTKEKSKRTITNADDISFSILFRRLKHDNIQMFKLVSIIYWWVYTLMLNIGKKSSNEPPLESQFSLPAKENAEPKDQEINTSDNILKRESRSLLTELKPKSKVSEETTIKTMLEHRAINATAYIERLPEEKIDPDFLDNLNNLTSFFFNSKNFQKLKTKSDVHNVTHIPVELNRSTVSPIAASSNNYQIVKNDSVSDMFEYPASVHNYTAPPIVTDSYIVSNVIYVHPKSNSTLTHILGESFDNFTESSIAASPDNYHQTEKNTLKTHNVNNDEVSNDKADNDDPSIHKRIVNFHRNEGDSTFKLKDNIKTSNKVEIYSDYSEVRYYSPHRIFLPFN